jgi:hypothetical protein
MDTEYENISRIKDIHKILTDITDIVTEEESKLIEDFNLGDEINKIVNKVRDGIVNDIVNPFKTFYNKAVETVKTGVTDIINKAKVALEGMINDIKKGFDDAIKKITDWFKKIGEDMKAGFEVVGNFFKDFVVRMQKMGDGLKDIFGGIGTEFTGLGEGLRLGFTNIGILFKWVGEFVFSYITCGVSYIQNLHRCIFFYVLDAVTHMAYTPVRMFMWGISGLTRRNDIYDAEKMIWDKIYQADELIYYYIGFHIAHYPKNVRDLCYNCKRMRVTALKNKVAQINDDFNVKMPLLLQKGVVEMQGGGNKFKGAFM